MAVLNPQQLQLDAQDWAYQLPAMYCGGLMKPYCSLRIYRQLAVAAGGSLMSPPPPSLRNYKQSMVAGVGDFLGVATGKVSLYL